MVRFIAGFLLGIVAASALPRRRTSARAAFPIRTPQELQDAASHLAYEYVSLTRGAETVESQKASGSVRRFDLEATLTHARNLVDFFWTPSGKRQPHRDGVYAIHYLPTSVDWITIRSSLPQFPSQRYDGMSAQLAHISTSRRKPTAPDFNAELERIASDLETVWKRWHAELDYWSKEIDEAVAIWHAKP